MACRYAAGVAPLGRALRAMREDDDEIRWAASSSQIPSSHSSDAIRQASHSQRVRLARSTGALAALPIALAYRSGTHLRAGELTTTAALIEEADELTASTGEPPLTYSTFLLAAWRGDKERLAELDEFGIPTPPWPRRRPRASTTTWASRAAHDMLGRFGADGFAERARRELLATGETVRKRSAADDDALTPQETQVARLAAEGQTNPEIGAHLFVSPRTAEYHLHKVFTKLGITSRRQLRDTLAQRERLAATS